MPYVGFIMNETSPETHENEHIDRFGAVASTLCALHCAVCALLPAAFGALGLGMLLSQEVEWGFTIVAVSFALVALILVVRQKRSYLITGLLGLGIIGLLTSRGLEMGSDHHHHGDEHHTEEHHDAHEDGHHDEHEDGHTKHKDEHHDEHDGEEHSDITHSAGAFIGVLGGILLLFGHLFNIRSMRSRKNDLP